jgi:hypothetical protein
LSVDNPVPWWEPSGIGQQALRDDLSSHFADSYRRKLETA